MSSQTTNLHLIKPAGNDSININDINGNMDIIDSAVSSKANSVHDHSNQSLTPTSITVSGDAILKSDNIDRDGTLPSETTCGNSEVVFTDADGELLGKVHVYRNISGSVCIQLNPYNEKDNGDEVAGYFNVWIGKDGAATYNMKSPENFRSAIGAADETYFHSAGSWSGMDAVNGDTIYRLQIGNSGYLRVYKSTDSGASWVVDSQFTPLYVSNSTAADCNTMDKNAITYYNANGPATSIGASTTDGALYMQRYSASWESQIAQDYRNGNLFTRGKNNGTWTDWQTVAYTKYANGYWGLTNAKGDTSGWTRTTTSGLIPYASGGSSSSLGTSSWPFNNIYGKTIYQNGTKVSVEGHTHNYAAASHTHSYLPLSGGTVTGSILFKQSTIDRDAANPSSVQYANAQMVYRDKNDENIGYIECMRQTDGAIGLQLVAVNENTSGNNVYNYIKAIITRAGASSYAVSNAANFRSAIGAAASSDRRLKSNIEPLGQDAVEFVKSLKPCVYDINGERQVGLIAQDVHEADEWGTRMAFETVEGIDGLDDWEKMEDGSPTWKLDYIRIIAPLTAALQDAMKRIDQLEARILELENTNNA